MRIPYLQYSSIQYSREVTSFVLARLLLKVFALGSLQKASQQSRILGVISIHHDVVGLIKGCILVLSYFSEEGCETTYSCH